MRRLSLAVPAALLLAGAAAQPVLAAPARLTAVRGAGAVDRPFHVARAGEALLSVRAAAPGVAWDRAGDESAVVSLRVDGRYVSDLVVTGAKPIRRAVALGRLSRGRHLLSARFAADRSPVGGTLVRLSRARVRVAPAAQQVALAHAPVLYGRRFAGPGVGPAVTSWGSPFQNAVTDTPLVAWHEATPGTAPGRTTLEYSVVWSNEDGGTQSPTLMARWGRTTDIEWIFRVEVDGSGAIVPGTAVYQGPDHATTPFKGRYQAGHPLLRTCTSNNNVCDDLRRSDVRGRTAMRFSLATQDTRPVDRAREVLMDRHPWTYAVMAAEMRREGKLEWPSDPLGDGLGDQRNYLYLEVDKDTLPANPALGDWVGVALGVRLRSGPAIYRSDQGHADWSIERDVPASTTVKLPAGTTPADVAQIIAYRVPASDAGGPGADTGATVRVTALNKARFLGADYAPGPSFARWRGTIDLTPGQPSAVLWSR